MGLAMLTQVPVACWNRVAPEQLAIPPTCLLLVHV
jgi:hypothetical protein